MVYDAAKGTLVLFGGLDRNFHFLNDTWTWNGVNWALQHPSSSPPPRYGAAMAYDAHTGTVVLFSGWPGTKALLDDTWTWDGTNWVQQHPPVSPSGREFPAAGDGTATTPVMIFGGEVAPSGCFCQELTRSNSETWTWDGTSDRWTLQRPAKSPSPRVAAAAATDPRTGQALLLGGDTSMDGHSGVESIETWMWNGRAWTQQHPASSPGAREAQGIAFGGTPGTALLFGGSGQLGVSLRDTWTWDGQTWTNQDHWPSPRRGASMARDPVTGGVLLFGGTDAASFRNDTWLWNGSRWTQLHPATSPPARERANMAYDPANHTDVLFGGEILVANPDGSTITTEVNDTWTWDGTTWTQRLPATAALPIPLVALAPTPRILADMAYVPRNKTVVLFGGSDITNSRKNDTWAWTGTAWINVGLVASLTGGAPPAREAGMMATDPYDGSVTLFGGDNGGSFLRDTWRWDGFAWSRLQSWRSPPGRNYAAMVSDPAGGNLVLFGGCCDVKAAYFQDTWAFDGHAWTQRSPIRLPAGRQELSAVDGTSISPPYIFGGQGDQGVRFNDLWAWQP